MFDYIIVVVLLLFVTFGKMTKRSLTTEYEKLWQRMHNIEKAYFALQLHVNWIENSLIYNEHQEQAADPKDKEYWKTIKEFYEYLKPLAVHMLLRNKSRYDLMCNDLKNKADEINNCLDQ
jgi:hypothetical protein